VRGGAIPVFAWGTILLASYVLNWIWEGGRSIEVAVTLAALIVIYGAGLCFYLARHESLHKGAPEPKTTLDAQPTHSIGAVLAGLSVGMILFGLAWAKFLVYLGIALLIVSWARLAVEWRSQRASLRSLQEPPE
jgi:sugar phosphate permease